MESVEMLTVEVGIIQPWFGVLLEANQWPVSPHDCRLVDDVDYHGGCSCAAGSGFLVGASLVMQEGAVRFQNVAGEYLEPPTTLHSHGGGGPFQSGFSHRPILDIG